MVQLSPSQILDVASQPECSEHGKERLEELGMADRLSSPCVLTSLLSLEATTAYYDYDNYIQDGLICLKHKVRNLEKKKLKLEDYKKRLYWGKELNKDQMAAVERYDEVLHNLTFAREIHKTLDILTQNLLGAQKKAMKKEQVVREEAERRRLTTVLQVQHLLHSLQQEHIRKDLLAGCNQAPHMQPQQLQSLRQLSSLLAVQSDNTRSFEEQMERVSLVYLDLLEGKDKPVAGSTFKLLKEELTRLLKCKYFSCLPPQSNKSPEVFLRVNGHSATSKPKPPDVPKEFFDRRYPSHVETASTQNWKEDFQSTGEQEPPDCWDMEFSDASPQAAINKPWRGAATLIPKGPLTTKKRRKETRAKREQHAKMTAHMDMPVDVFNSPYALPKDPLLRKQHFEDFMTKIHSSFSFMQDSLLDGEMSPRLTTQSGSLSPLGSLDQDHSSLRSPVNVLSKAMHSTPLPTRLKDCEANLENMDQCMETCDLKLSSKETVHEPLLVQRKTFSSPPLYCRDPTITVNHERSRARTPVTESGKESPSNKVATCTLVPPQEQTFSTPPARRTLAQFQNIQSVFKVTLPQKGESNSKPDRAVFDKPRYSTASTQTPPEFAPSEEEAQLGGSFTPQAHLKDTGPLLYAAAESEYQSSYRHGGGRHNSSAAWSDSSQVSTSDQEGAFTVLDSGHGDSLEVPVTPHGQHHALLPMHIYPLSQPLRVAFNVSRTANFAPGNLDQPIVFDQMHSNLGEMFDTHIGRFTCPVNGTYVFIFHILKLAINVPLYINLMRNEEVMVSAYANDGAPDHETASNHAILPLFQGDQVWLRLHRGAIYGSTWKYSTFSGFLLYQD